MRPDLFADRGFAVGAVLVTGFFGMFTAFVFAASITLQDELRISAPWTGMAMTVVPVFVSGLGVGVFGLQLLPVMLAGLDQGQMGETSGLLPTLEQIGNAVGLAVLSTVSFRAHTLGGSITMFAAIAAIAVVAAGLAGVTLLLPDPPQHGAPEAPVTDPAPRPRRARRDDAAPERAGTWFDDARDTARMTDTLGADARSPHSTGQGFRTSLGFSAQSGGECVGLEHNSPRSVGRSRPRATVDDMDAAPRPL